MRAFDLAVLEHLLGADGLLDALDEAAAAGLIDDAAGGRYHFAHALTRDAVYGGIGRARRSDLHRRAAAALEQVHGLEPGPELGDDRAAPARGRRARTIATVLSSSPSARRSGRSNETPTSRR